MTDVLSGLNPPDVGGADPDDACPLCGRKKHDDKYRRRKSERKKALLRDADDPDADLDPKARAFIKENNGDRVPKGYEVSHEVPLYTEPKESRCQLDTADNMKTQPKDEHRKRHEICGDQYHLFGPP
jgi:hypothetical protein